MGLLRHELGKPRWSGGGLVLLLVLFPLLLYPILRNREISHPLSAQMHLDVCARIPVPSKLPPPWHTKTIDANGNLICEFRNDTNSIILSVYLPPLETYR